MISEEMFWRFKACCEKQGRTMSGVIRQAILEFIKENEQRFGLEMNQSAQILKGRRAGNDREAGRESICS